jgi:hypothetical protein
MVAVVWASGLSQATVSGGLWELHLAGHGHHLTPTAEPLRTLAALATAPGILINTTTPTSNSPRRSGQRVK